MQLVERSEDVRKYSEHHGAKDSLSLEPFSGYYVAEVAFVDRYEDLNNRRGLESLTSLIRHNMLYDILQHGTGR